MKEEYNVQGLILKLKNMKLSGMAEELQRQMNDPNFDLLPFEERIDRIICEEWNLRYAKKFSRYLKAQTFAIPMPSLTIRSMIRNVLWIRSPLKDSVTVTG